MPEGERRKRSSQYSDIISYKSPYYYAYLRLYEKNRSASGSKSSSSDSSNISEYAKF